MIQKEFARNAARVLEKEEGVIGLAVGGSWLTNDMDEFSDVDLILITEEKVSGDKNKMLEYAGKLGNFLSGFTGEHVGEPRVLICLYDAPLLHVDIKFLTLSELDQRVETPHLLLDREGQVQKVLDQSNAKFPMPDYQRIEDRFWTWIHYVLLKIGRGEYLEAFDFFGFLRMLMLGPLLHIKNGNLPRAVRKVETELNTPDFIDLKGTIPTYDRTSLLKSLRKVVTLYQSLRATLFDDTIHLQAQSEEKVMTYFQDIENKEV